MLRASSRGIHRSLVKVSSATMVAASFAISQRTIVARNGYECSLCCEMANESGSHAFDTVAATNAAVSMRLPGITIALGYACLLGQFAREHTRFV